MATRLEDVSVVIIEDNPADADLIRMELAQAGIRDVRHALTGTEGLDLVRDRRADLVFVDYGLPAVDGLEVLRELLALDPTLAAIFLTNNREVRIVKEALRLGAADYVTKDEITAGALRQSLVTVVDGMLRRHQASEIKQDLVSIVSHDLIVPLSNVLGFAELLLDRSRPQLSPEQTASVSRILANATYMHSLISSILAAIRLSAGTFRIRPVQVDLPGLLEQLLDRIGHLATAKAIRVARSFPLPHVTVLADPTMVEQVVTNLVSNAIKFAPRESGVEIGFVLEPGVVRVWVRDEGPGIPEGEHSHLFEKLSQGSARPQGWESGSGLGLYIVDRIVRAHGGQVRVDSRMGVGTTMSFTLPLF